MTPASLSRRILLSAMLGLVALGAMSCAGVPAGEGPMEADLPAPPASTRAPTAVPTALSWTPTPAPADETPSAAPAKGMGETVSSTAGGYRYRELPGYQVLESYGYSVMAMPDSDPEIGPAFLFLGGPNIDQWDVERLIEVSMRPGMVAAQARGTSIDGLAARIVDTHSPAGAPDVTGRLIAIAQPGRTFTLEAYAPRHLWEAEVEAQFEAVLASITFHDQVPVSGLAPGATRAPSMVHPIDEGFLYDVSGPDEERTVIGGYIENYTTDGEFIYGLVSGDRRYIVTLFLPRDLAEEGTFTLLVYEPESPRTGPSAAVVIDDRQFGATEGTLHIDAAHGRLLSGEIELTAVHPHDATLVVTVRGEFSRLPLELP